MKQNTAANESHHYTTIDDDARTVRVTDDIDAIHTVVEVEVPIESQEHMPADWTTDTWSVRFSERYDAEGNIANVDV